MSSQWMSFHGNVFLIPDEPNIVRYFEDEAEIRNEHWNVQAGELVIDVGSGPGSYAITALACGANVIVAEASQWAADKLQEIADLNGFSDRLQISHAACGEPYAPELAITIPDYMRPPDDARWESLDLLAPLSRVKKVDWIKIDVEGGELGVLNSGIALLKRDHPKLLIENHDTVYEWVRNNHIEDQIDALLADLGYVHTQVPYTGRDGFRSSWVAQ